FAGNIRTLLDGLESGVAMTAVVKANAYGHGAPAMARTAIEAGANRLAVATVGEGRQLRRADVAAPIVALGAIDPAEAPAAVALSLELMVGTETLLAAVERAAADAPEPLAMHVLVDTGLRRYGAMPELAIALARRIAAHPNLRLQGLATHFATSEDAGDTFADEQRDLLLRVVDALAREGIAPATVHMANSGALLRGSAFHADAVRGGIAIYGIAPSIDRPLPGGVRPALTLHSRVQRVFDLASGDTVGYGRTLKVERPMRAALVPIGYADGYRRQLANHAWMIVGGERAPLLGRVSMDQAVVAAPGGVDVQVGTEVIVAGGDPALGAPSMDDLGAMVGTNSYEMLTGISARVPRHYVRAGEVVEIAEMATS
ncbi:MAG TPA: alanine racemase, partial [Thermomicrobiales bacterium]|nr:alanine racemase [Thermomicrobiales bacterium]